MKIIWPAPERQSTARARTEFENRTRKLHYWERVDAVIVILVVMLVILCSGLWLAGVQYANVAGLFDLDVSRPLADERLLNNIRDEIGLHPLLDAVFHPPAQALYITQDGGLIHTYTPSTGLWDTSRPFSNGALQNPNVTLLRSGCGADPAHTLPDPCADPNSVWGVTELGALVRQSNSGWAVVLGDSQFIGAQGKVVETADLTTAALSSDGKWLLLGTPKDGIGLYDMEAHSWVQLARDLYAALPSLQVTHLVWAQNRFWIGSPKGLAVLEPDRLAPKLIDVQAEPGQVLDMDVAPNGLVWVLLSRPCIHSGNDCRWLGAFSNPATVQELMREENIYPLLNETNLIFAKYQPADHRLIVAGQAGIYSYDTLLHGWSQWFDGNVRTVLAFPDNQGFYVGYAGGVGSVTRDGFRELGTLDGQTVIKLAFTGRLELLAVVDRVKDRAVYSFSLRDAAPPTLVFQTSSSTFAPNQLKNAVALDDIIFFSGPQGVVLHNTLTRSFEDIPIISLPAWLGLEDTRLINAGDYAYGLVSPALNTGTYYAVPTLSLGSRSYLTNNLGNEKSISLPGPVTQSWKWERASIGILGAQGSIFHLTPQGAERMTGAPIPALNDIRWFDAAALGSDTFFSAGDGLWRYDGQRRDWERGVGLPPGTEPRELVEFAGQILAQTDRGALVLAGSNSSILIPADAFQNDNDTFSDVRRAGDSLYLAGQGKVDRYDMNARRIAGRWKLEDTTGPVRLQGIVNGIPLSQVKDRAYLGDNALDVNAGAVVNLSLDTSTIWTVRESEGTRYLKGYHYDERGVQDTVCFYRNPSTNTSVHTLIDSRRLSSGIVAIWTDAGLWFYRPEGHSWYAGPSEFANADGRLYLLGKYLVLVQSLGNESRLTFIAQDAISIPPSCERGAARFDAQPILAKAVTVNEATGRVGWLTKDGQVFEWQDGNITSVLPPTTTGPAARELRRVFTHLPYVYFASGGAVWQYELAVRRWTKLELRGMDSGSLADLNIEFLESTGTVTARNSEGHFFLGTFQPNDTIINVQEIFSPPAETFNNDPNTLLDVQTRSDGLWTFVLPDRIRYFEPRDRRWLTDADIEADASLQFGSIADWPVATGQSGRVWWIADQNSSHPAGMFKYTVRAPEQTALSTSGNLWRWQPNGTVLRCTPPYAEADCVRAAPENFALNPDDVRQAYAWGEIELFETVAGLRAFDPTRNSEVPLPDSAAQFHDVKMRRVVGNELWLGAPNELLSLSFENHQVNAVRTRNVRMIAVDENREGWALIDGQWRKWNQNEWSPLPVENGQSSDEANIRLFANEGAVTTGVGADGRLYVWSGALRASTWRLPQSIALSEITALYREDPDSWWAQADSRFYHFTSGLCPIRLPPPPTPTFGATESPKPTDLATAQPSRVPTGTSTPQPSPTTASEPCLVVESDVLLPNDFVRSGQIQLIRELGKGELVLWNEAGISTGILHDDKGLFRAVETTYLFPPLPDIVQDQWQTLRGFVQTLSDGSRVFNPITGISPNGTGDLVAKRPRGDVELGERGSLTFELAPALDVGWLKWERKSHVFTVTTPGGQVTLTPQQFIRDGALPFERVNAVLAPNSSRLYTANAQGITFLDATLSLDDPAITFQPISLALPIAAVRGQFYTRNGQLFPDTGQLQPLQGEYRVSLQDLELVENITAQQVRGSTQVEGRTHDILTDTGFLWDQDRRGLAYENGSLRLATALGIGPLNRIENFYHEPATAETGHLVSEGEGVYFQAGASWFARVSSAWQPIGDPTANRELFQDSRWTWRVRNSQILVALNRTRYNFSADVTSQGFGFSSDRLLAASSANGQLFVATEAFLQVGVSADEIANWAAARDMPVPADAFDTFSLSDGRMRLVRRLGSLLSEWSAVQKQFDSLASDADPYLFRQLAEAERIRFRLDNGKVVKELRFDSAAAPGGWVPFQLEEKRFPFDVVTSLAVFENQLQVGTAAGLETHNAPLNLDLNGMTSFYDLRAGTGSPAAITRVGTPYTRPDVLMVQSTMTCVERSTASNFAACQEPNQLANRLRLRNDFWEWTRRDDNLAHGNYRSASGQAFSDEIMPSNGRLPHDEISRVAICQGNTAVLWKRGWVTIHSQIGVGLLGGARTFSFEDLPTSLSCLERPVDTPRVHLNAGFYLQIGATRIAAFDGASWIPLSNNQETEVMDRSTRPRVYEHSRLRLLEDGGPFRFEQQTLAGDWLALAWKQGHLDIDEWNDLVQVNDQLWAATRAGLATFSRDADGRARLDPDRLLLIHEPNINGEPCAVSDFATKGVDVTLRCNYDSQQVYIGTLDGTRDQNVFAHSNDDPFVVEKQVDQETNGKWVWQRAGNANGNPGFLESRLDTRPTELNSGRFALDELTTMTFYTQTLVEIASAHGGAWQSDMNRFGLLDWKNPTQRRVDPAQVTQIFKTRADAKIGLCFKLEDQFMMVLPSEEPGQTEQPPKPVGLTCAEYLGADTLWVYTQNQSKLEIFGKEAAISTTARELRAGRFTDDIAIGLPVASQVNGDIVYWLPTRAGILQLNRQLLPFDMIGPPFAGLGTAVPTSLFLPLQNNSIEKVENPRAPFYVAPDGIYQLAARQAPQAILSSQVLADHEPVLITRAPGKTLRLLWEEKGQRHWSWLDAETFTMLGGDQLTLDSQSFDDYQWVKPDCSSHATQLNLEFLPNGVKITDAEGQAQSTVRYEVGFHLQAAIPVRDRLFLIGQNNVGEVNLEAALRRLCGK